MATNNEPLPSETRTSEATNISVPDCVGELMGVRLFSWPYRRAPIYSLYQPSYVWDVCQPQLEAECAAGEEYYAYYLKDAPTTSPPHKPGTCGPVGHACGLHGFYSLSSLWANTYPHERRRNLIGIVSAWGAIEEHEHGFRAQYMRLRGIVLSFLPLRWRNVCDTAASYGVPVVWAPYVEGFMRELGTYVA